MEIEFLEKLISYSEKVEDKEISMLIKDLGKVLMVEEWYRKGKYDKDIYQEKIRLFKSKWFKDLREERLIKIINKEIDRLRSSLIEMIE